MLKPHSVPAFSTLPGFPTLSTLALAGLLAGCASTRLVDSDVNSFGAWPPGRAPATFAFERLPSQQAQPEQQAQLEAAALPALEQAGFRPAAARAPSAGTAPALVPPDVLVQVAARTLRYDGAWNGDPFWPGGAFYRGGVGRWRGGGSVGLYGVRGWAPTYYLNEVSMLIRDARTQQVLYETRAQNDGVWFDAAVRAALFDAALKDFPRPALSPRRVTVEIPR